MTNLPALSSNDPAYAAFVENMVKLLRARDQRAQAAKQTNPPPAPPQPVQRAPK